MSQRISENIIICFDISRSMYRKDYAPNRLEASKKAIQNLVSTRLKDDPSTSFAIITISDKPKTVLDFINAEATIIGEINALEFKGNSALGDALASAIQKLISELRKVGAKVPRILVVSDGNFTKTSVDPIKMANLASKLNIKIDTFRLGEVSHVNLLKRLSDITKGQYYYNNNSASMIESAKKFADSNVKDYTMSIKTAIENPAFLRKIAANLLRTQDLTKDQEERIKQIRGEADYKKCVICFADKCPYTAGTFFTEGRYCPNCSTPMHLHCAAEYAKSAKDEKQKESGTFRCPHCFYLLKIPSEVQQISKLSELRRPEHPSRGGGADLFHVKMQKAEELGEESMYNACPACHMIFEEGQDVVKCGNPECTAMYHFNCFEKLEDTRCSNCGVELRLT